MMHKRVAQLALSWSLTLLFGMCRNALGQGHEVLTISGTIFQRAETTNAIELKSVVRFELEIKNDEDWRAKLLPLVTSYDANSIIPQSVTHVFSAGSNYCITSYDPSLAPKTSRNVAGRKPSTIISENAEVYDSPFPYWDQWGCTALWLTYCSKSYLSRNNLMPSALYTMDRDSTLPSVSGFNKKFAEDQRIGVTNISVSFASVFPTSRPGLSIPIFEFSIESQTRSHSSAGLALKSLTRFGVPESAQQRNERGDHFKLVYSLEVSATNIANADSFSFGGEVHPLLSVRDSRIRTKSGNPVSYISTNGIPTISDSNLVKYAARYEQREQSLGLNSSSKDVFDLLRRHLVQIVSGASFVCLGMVLIYKRFRRA